VSTSPRSRWSNRDESSYKEQKSDGKTNSRGQFSKWKPPKADSSSSMLITGQLTSLVSLFMLYSGTKQSVSQSPTSSPFWGLGDSALIVTVIFGIISFMFLFRVSFSKKAPKRRRRIARIWLLSVILATQLT
tara:strand:- start:821 stop:1216 length:396 start_codon:yes stop_codon:yes gene_type:complete